MTAPDPHAAAVRQARREAFEEAARVCDLWCEVNRELVHDCWARDPTWRGDLSPTAEKLSDEIAIDASAYAATAFAAKYMAEAIRKIGEGL